LPRWVAQGTAQDGALEDDSRARDRQRHHVRARLADDQLETLSKPAIMRSMVVLPQPEGPSIEKNSPRPTSKLASCTAT